LVKFDISDNALRADGGKALAGALKNNNIMKELNIASNTLGKNSSDDADMSGVLAFCDAILTMGALTKLLMGANNIHGAEAGKALGDDVAANTVLKELDLSAQKVGRFGKALDAAFAKKFAIGVGANGALEKLLMGANNIKGAEAGKALGDSIAANTVLKELNIAGRGEWPDHVPGCDVEFVKAFAVGLGANGALTKVNVSNNKMACKEVGKALGDMLKTNSVLQDLDVSNNYHRYTTGANDGPGFAKELALGVSANGALVKFDIGNNGLFANGGKALAEALKGNNVMQELNIASNVLARTSSYHSDMSGVIAISDAIPTMGALVSANLLNNNIGTEQAHSLATILKDHATLQSLCGNKGDETELDMSGAKMGAEGAIMLAPEIVANGAMASLNISENNIGQMISQTKSQQQLFKELRSEGLSAREAMQKSVAQLQDIPLGVLALAEAFKYNGALTSLNIDNNRIPAELADAIVQSACRGSKRPGEAAQCGEAGGRASAWR
jgi:Ran GTPase-activating protein (RanGAP) involved in mRNA processing and transport